MSDDGAPQRRDDLFLKIFREHAAVMLLIESDSGWILDANPAAEVFYGYSREQFQKLNIAAIRQASVENVFGGKQQNLSLHKIASGNIRTVEEQAAHTRVDDADVTYLIVHDRTEQMLVEQALRESEGRFRSMVDRIMDGFYRSTHDGRFVDVNPAMVRMFGFASREEMLKVDIKRDLYFSAQERGSHILDTGQEEIEVYRMRRKDGSEIWVEDHGHYVHDEDGEILYHEGILRDVTERVHMEEALHQRLIELEALHSVSASLRSVISLDDALPVLLEHTLSALSTDTGTLLLYYPETDDLRDTCPMGWFKDLKGINLKVGEGMAGTVFATGQPHYSVEFVKDPLARPGSLSSIPAGWGGACIPIRAGAEMVGVMFVAVKLPRHITPEQLKLLQSLAEIAGATLHQVKLHDELVRRAEEFESLFETSQALSQQTELEPLLQSIVHSAKRLLYANSSGMYLYDPAAHEMVLTMDTDPFIVKGTRLTLDEGAAGYVARTRKTLRLDDYSKWEGRSTKYEGVPLRAVMEVPMLYGGDLIGVLAVDEVGDSKRVFTDADERLLSLFASQAAGVIHSTRLRDEALHRLQNLQTLHTIDKTIASSLDLRITLNILLTHVIDQLGPDAADVLFLHPYEQILQYASGRGFRTRLVEGAEVHLNDDFSGRAVMERRIVKVTSPSEIVSNPLFYDLWTREGFVNFMSVPLIARGEVKGVLEIYGRKPLNSSTEWFEFLETLAGQAAITIDNASMFDNIQRVNMELAIANEATIEGWSRAMELRSRDYAGHTARAVDLTLQLARAMQVRDPDLQHIRHGALLHDIGSISIPERILLKKGKLTASEWEEIYKHPVNAFQLMNPIQHFRQALDIPYCHHEKWDGSGYPRGLKGGQIPLSARIFAVADVWDALLSPRPHRPAWTRKEALVYIREQSGRHFDPQIVTVFLEMMDKADVTG